MSQLSSAAQGTERIGEQDLLLLMLRYQRGEAESVDSLVRALSPLLWRYFSLSTGARADTEDLLQDCWLRIHRSRHTYRPSEPLLPWIFALARHTRLDAYRRKQRRAAKETLMATPPEIAISPEILQPRDSERLALMLDALPDSQREVLVMLKVADMSLEEVARATSSTVGAIKQKVHRAYARLREILERDGAGGRKK